MSDELNLVEQPALPNLPENYQFAITNEKETGLLIASLTDNETGITLRMPIPNPEIDYHNRVAWAGARFSRNADGLEEIFKEIELASQEDQNQAAKKLAKVFVNYGHASVADLTTPTVSIEGITMEEALTIFNIDSRQSGQELSTRYVKIGDFNIPSLESMIDLESLPEDQHESFKKQWQEMQDYLAEQYKRWYPLVEEPIREYIETQLKQQDPNAKLSKSTLNAWVLDIVRGFIPFGAGLLW